MYPKDDLDEGEDLISYNDSDYFSKKKDGLNKKCIFYLYKIILKLFS